MAHEIEVTDTFGGESNYCWVKRGITEAQTRRQQIAAVREVAGWPTSIRVDCEDWGDTLVIRPRGVCQVAFVTYKEEA